MKKGIMILLTALLMAPAGMSFAAADHQEAVSCQLAAKNCLNKADIIQKRVKKLEKEVKQGSTKYTPEEMKQLEQKLQETKELLDKLEAK
jgi:prephenate dehydrogenase